jgi:hypothetical protein
MTEQTAGSRTPNQSDDQAPAAVSDQETPHESTRNDVPAGDAISQGTALYAATNLESWETDKPHHFARDVGIDGTCFRRLDPDYYAWLRHKMDAAKKAMGSGRLPSQAFETLRCRFNVVHAWAMDCFGEEPLLSAVRALNPRTYSPPALGTYGQDPRNLSERAVPDKPPSSVPQYLFPKDGDWRFTQRVPPSAVAKVDAIRDQALSLGWSEARLYQNRGRFRFPCGQDYGLVCFVDEKERIGDVTRRNIEIIGPPPRENRLRFHNPDVDQPWLKKTKNEN